jgi:hypothetical protein
MQTFSIISSESSSQINVHQLAWTESITENSREPGPKIRYRTLAPDQCIEGECSHCESFQELIFKSHHMLINNNTVCSVNSDKSEEQELRSKI